MVLLVLRPQPGAGAAGAGDWPLQVCCTLLQILQKFRQLLALLDFLQTQHELA